MKTVFGPEKRKRDNPREFNGPAGVPYAETQRTNEIARNKRVNDMTSFFGRIVSCSGKPADEDKETQVAKLSPEDHGHIQNPVTLLFLETGFRPEQVSTDSGYEAPSMRWALRIDEKDNESAARYGLISLDPGRTDILVRIDSRVDSFGNNELHVRESDYRRQTEHEQTELLEEMLERIGTDEAGLAQIAEEMEADYSS